MKTVASELAYFLRGRARQNLKLLLLYGLFLLLMTLSCATIFRFLMLHLEGREYSFIAGVYWAITVMTTLGFGDITFHTDLGYIFAAVVTVSGVIFLLIILPFGLISLFLAPWIEQRLRYGSTFSLPKKTAGHVIVFGLNPITREFIKNLIRREIPFVAVTEDYHEQLNMEEEGNIRVACGSVTDKALLSKVRVESALYVFANLSDTKNISLCLTVRSLCQTPIAATVGDAERLELMRLSGADKVVPLSRIIGRYLGIRATTQGASAHIIDSFGLLKIAEIPVYCTPFSGMTLEQAAIRQKTGLAVIGIWERGVFTVPAKDTPLNPKALIVLVGTQKQLTQMEQMIGEQAENDLVFILGHGKIGCAAANFLDHAGVPYLLFDQAENQYCTRHVAVLGDATNRELLRKSGIDKARGLIVTTNDDATNVFLTLSSRHANPYIRIVARANSEESVQQLYAAGADFVVSNSSVGANILTNILEAKESIFLTEGLKIFRRPVPIQLQGRSIEDSKIRPLTGCSVVALEQDGANPLPSPAPDVILTNEMRLVMIGNVDHEENFNSRFPPKGA
jgi:Trk K+ transport system NAD-binding subunit